MVKLTCEQPVDRYRLDSDTWESMQGTAHHLRMMRNVLAVPLTREMHEFLPAYQQLFSNWLCENATNFWYVYDYTRHYVANDQRYKPSSQRWSCDSLMFYFMSRIDAAAFRIMFHGHEFKDAS